MLKNAAKRLWHSPTFNTWVNQAVTALRLVAVTPLILTRFDKVEIAAWFLLGSLNFFGQILSGRLSLTFSRMIAFAMGGATDLAPIASGQKVQRRDAESSPNWELVGRAYGTMGVIRYALAGVVALVAGGMAWYGVGNLVRDYDGPVAPLWAGAGITVFVTAVGFIQSQYSAALVGLNQVALSNRVNSVFNLLSVLAGFAVLSFGGSFLLLVIVMQAITLIGGFRSRILLRRVEGERFRQLASFRWDSEVAHWAWEPIWKGLIGQLSNAGVLQLSGVLITRIPDPSAVAGYLFALRLLRVMTQVTQAPFLSHQPKFSTLLAAGDIETLRPLLLKRTDIAVTLFAVGILAVASCMGTTLNLIGAKIAFVPTEIWLLLGALSFWDRFNLLCLSTVAIGNRILYYLETAIGGIISLILMAVIAPYGLAPTVLAAFMPQLLILGIGPLNVASKILEISRLEYLKRAYLKGGILLAVGFLIKLFI